MFGRSLFWGAVAALALLPGFGCSTTSSQGDQAKKPLVQYSIKILRDGKPLEGALVTLYPQKPKSSAIWYPTGTTGKDGIAQIMTKKPGDGAEPGEYDVTVQKIAARAPIRGMGDAANPQAVKDFLNMDASKVSELPLTYGDKRTSGLHCTVTAGSMQTFDLKGKPEKPASKPDHAKSKPDNTKKNADKSKNKASNGKSKANDTKNKPDKK